MYSYSSRLSWSFFPNTYVQSVQTRRSAGIQLIDLTISNPTAVLTGYPHRQIAESFGKIRDFTYEPNPFGLLAARQAVARYYQRRSIAADPRNILLTASTSEAYALLFKLFCNAGDEVLAPLPSYPLFEYLAAAEAVTILPYPLQYDGNWYIDFTSLKRQISPRTRAIVLVNPNNPTGSFLKEEERQALFQLSEEHHLPLIADEVFHDYSIESKPGRVQTLIGSDAALSFSLNGLSKAAGMPQMKVGWIVINGFESQKALARERLELLLDTYLSVNTPAQLALADLLQIGEGVQEQLASRIRQNYDAMQTVLSGTPAHCLHLEGGWSAVIKLPRIMTEDAWLSTLLDDYNLIVQPGYFFDMADEPHIVISLITPPELFLAGLQQLKQAQRNP